MGRVNFFTFRGNKGISIVGVLVAVGIMGVVAVTLSKVLSTSFKGNKSFRQKNDKEQLRLFILGRISCKQTFEGVTIANCNSTGFTIDLKDKGGSTFLAASGGNIGNWNLIPWCQNNTLQVRAGLKNPDGSWAKDPLRTTITLDNTTASSDLFRQEIPLCGEIFGSTSNPQLGPGFTTITGSSEPECDSRVCPSGYVVTGWGAHVTGNDIVNCSISCTQLSGVGIETAVAQTVTGSSESACDSLSCPAGYIAKGWGAHVTGNDIVSCKLECVKFDP